MTDLEVNEQLALAIGWKPEQIKVLGLTISLPDERLFPNGPRRIFDYRDPAVIWPIAERYDCFPIKQRNGKWRAWVGFDQVMHTSHTAAKAVALAVIENAK